MGEGPLIEDTDVKHVDGISEKKTYEAYSRNRHKDPLSYVLVKIFLILLSVVSFQTKWIKKLSENQLL